MRKDLCLAALGRVALVRGDGARDRRVSGRPRAAGPGHVWVDPDLEAWVRTTWGGEYETCEISYRIGPVPDDLLAGAWEQEVSTITPL